MRRWAAPGPERGKESLTWEELALRQYRISGLHSGCVIILTYPAIVLSSQNVKVARSFASRSAFMGKSEIHFSASYRFLVSIALLYSTLHDVALTTGTLSHSAVPPNQQKMQSHLNRPLPLRPLRQLHD